jgi:hypothetical protein
MSAFPDRIDAVLRFTEHRNVWQLTEKFTDTLAEAPVIVGTRILIAITMIHSGYGGYNIPYGSMVQMYTRRSTITIAYSPYF